MVYKALLWTEVFWKPYIKWYKFYNNNLSVVFGGTLELVTPKHSDWALNEHNEFCLLLPIIIVIYETFLNGS